MVCVRESGVPGLAHSSSTFMAKVAQPGTTLPGWRQALARAVSAQDSSRKFDEQTPPLGQHWAQLATTRAASGSNTALSGRPTCRTVNIRTLTKDAAESASIPDGQLFGFLSDSRSAKVADIKERSFAELLLFFPSTMTQFRCSGRISIVGGGPEWGGDREQNGTEADVFWGRLTAKERRFFAWPSPGARREHRIGSEADKLLFEVEGPTDRPEIFVFCRLQPDFVEVLDLKTFPHVRCVYERAEAEPHGWSCRHVNP